MTASLRETVFAYCLETYGTVPDSPFPKDPLDMVLRHANTRKWYGLLFPVERRKLLPLMRTVPWGASVGAEEDHDRWGFGDSTGFAGTAGFSDFGDSLVSRGRAAHLRDYEDEMFGCDADDFGPGASGPDAFGFGPDGFDPDEKVDVINLKCDPIAAQSLHTRPGIMPAYHMNHTQWITVLLDGTVPPGEIFPLIDMSYELTASKSKRPADGGPREWLVPSNPKFFDVIGAFEAEEEIDWKQSSAVHVGDTVYLYVGAPVSAILYRCTATKVNIPFFHQDENLTIRKLMRIRREHVYARDEFPIARLRDEFEVRSVRGPRGVHAELSEELKRTAGL